MSALTPDETILGLLAAQAQHGYQLLETFSDPARLGNVWNLSTSQLYAVLKRLERQGWILGCEQDSENAPPRVEFTITDAGRSHLHNWLHDPHPSPSIRRIRVEFMSRLYVAQLLREPIQPIIACQRAACQAERARILHLQENSPPGMGWLASDMVIAQLDAVLQWIDRCEMALYSPEN
ncbi:MAG: PadR family transcriptional regulator [Anaerolineae bacterium]|nr:PadR family transcriptional regulator [Anaerolineae bacterium]